MTDHATSLTLGSPCFTDARLHALASTQGALSAWRAALKAQGWSAAAQVSGDFAVALHEPGGCTFLAVDRFAIHPLCYRVDQGQLRFATRADTLADTDTALDPQALFDYLYFHVIPSPRTIFKGIFRLPPAHYALFEHGTLTVAPYWTPHFEEQANTPWQTRQTEFRQLLHTCVSAQLDDTQPACFLSGGTDSSTVVGMATQASGRTVASYSIGFDAPGYDEMEYARLAARHFKTDHHEYYVTPADLLRSIPSVAAQFDQPFGNSSALPAYYCAKLAQDNGVHKLLAGDGGDELFGGNARYARQKIFDWYALAPKPLQTGLIEPLLSIPGASRFALTRKAASYVEQARQPMPQRLQMYNLLTRLGAHTVLTPALLAQVDPQGPLQQQQAVWHSAGECSELNRALAFDWRFTLAESDLPKVTGAARLAGIGTAFPLLDNRLLAFSQQLPSHYKLKGLQLRWFFKAALKGFLPDAILRKKKQGFGLPFGLWTTQTPALQALAHDALNSLAARNIVRTDFMHRLMHQQLAQHPGYFGEMVWILMMLEHWLQKHAPNYRI